MKQFVRVMDAYLWCLWILKFDKRLMTNIVVRVSGSSHQVSELLLIVQVRIQDDLKAKESFFKISPILLFFS
jgi:hypothetical protein